MFDQLADRQPGAKASVSKTIVMGTDGACAFNPERVAAQHPRGRV